MRGEGGLTAKKTTPFTITIHPQFIQPLSLSLGSRGGQGQNGKLTKLPKPLQNTIMHAQPRHNRLRLVGNHQQNRAYGQCEQSDQDDGGEGSEGRSGFGVVGQECLEGFYEACNVCEGCEGA